MNEFVLTEITYDIHNTPLHIVMNTTINGYWSNIFIKIKNQYFINNIDNFLIKYNDSVYYNKKFYYNVNLDLIDLNLNTINIYKKLLNGTYGWDKYYEYYIDEYSENDKIFDKIFYTDDKDEILKFKLLY